MDSKNSSKHAKKAIQKQPGDFANSTNTLITSPDEQPRTSNQLTKSKSEKQKHLKESMNKLKSSEERKWLVSRGKKHLIGFDDKERAKLRQFFDTLDADGSGSIGVEELEDPFISLGLASSREEVQKLIDSVDEDDSRQIEFNEFLHIVSSKNNESSVGDQSIIDFFKDMIKGNLAEGQVSNKLPLHLIISTLRRKKLMDAMLSNDEKKKQEGSNVLTNYANLLTMRQRIQEWELRKQREMNQK